jgi:DNA-binding PadR family transcriptional regulator
MYRFDTSTWDLRMIDLAILGLLREQDLHGYELRKRITDLPGLKPAVSFGSLYPALARLQGAEAVSVVEPVVDPDPTMPPTGSLAGEAAAFLARRRNERTTTKRTARAKKAYRITEAGERLLVDLIEDPATDDREFPLKVAFCRNLTGARRLELFERHRAVLAGHLAGERTSRRRAGERLDAYVRSLREHDHQTIQHDIAWLDELIANERAALTAPAGSREEETRT